MANKNLNAAKEAKKDEFYTQLEDINNELRHYREHFRGKTVLCNCDDPRVSNFFTYFAYNFEFLGLKRLITTCYKNQDMDLFSQNSSIHSLVRLVPRWSGTGRSEGLGIPIYITPPPPSALRHRRGATSGLRP
jgi:hypothetical protein